MKRAPFELLVICDESASQSVGRSVCDTVRELLQSEHAHRCAFLLRDKDPLLSAAQRERRVHHWAQQLAPLCLESAATLLVHTFAEVALEFEGCGVHFDSRVEQSVVAGFKSAHSERCVGQSLHRGDDACAALDYATMSPVFAPFSKANDLRQTLGVQGFVSEQERLSALSLVALGGIDVARARLLRTRGAPVAMLSVLMKAQGPREVLDGVFRAL